MGGIISKLRQSNDSDYEKILSDLDSNIRKAELRLSAINVRERRLLGHWMTYSILAWLGYTAVFVLYLNKQYQDDPQLWAVALAPIIAGLPVIYAGRSVISLWYKRAKTFEESQLNMLRADQRLKVEELKKKTAYYSTKTLLERYDPASQRPGGLRPISIDGKPVLMSQNGQPRQLQPNMMDPGLRQRQGQGLINAAGIQGHLHGVSSGMQPHKGSGPQNPPRGPQGIPGPQQQFNQGALVNRPAQYGSPNSERHWYDKIVDVIVGDEGPETKYALVCGQCFAHNGLVLPQEIDEIQYVCPKCNFFNPSRRKTRQGQPGLQPPSTPELTLLQAQAKPLPASREPSPSPSGRFSPSPSGRHSSLAENKHLEYSHQNTFDHNSAEVSESRSPDRMPDFQSPVIVNSDEADDIEFVNNWNDSDAEGVNHDEGDDEDDEQMDDTRGYVVEKIDDSQDQAVVSSTKTKKTDTGIKTRSAAKRVTKELE